MLLSRFAKLSFFGVAPLLIGIAVTPAVSSPQLAVNVPQTLIAKMVRQSSTSASTSIFDTTWLAEDIEGHGVIDDAQSTLRISKDGRAGGMGACNNFFSAASVSDATIKVEVMGATMMMCPPAVMDQEKRFFDALAKARTFRFESDGKLTFVDKDGRAILRFARSG